MTPAEKVMKARINLVLDQPFFGTLLLRLIVVEDPTCDTFWTDGTQLGYNPDYCDGLSLAEVQGVLCHEVLHCAMGHQFREQGREHERWNEAADYAINPIVRSAGMVLPQGALLNQTWADKSAEWIYSQLPSKPPSGSSNQPGNQPGSGSGPGEVRAAKGSDVKAQEAAWEVATQQAAAIAQGQGRLPAGVAIAVTELTRPRVNWKAELRRFVQQFATDDYSWQQPNPRYIQSGFYLPLLRSESMPPIVVFSDSSGSTRSMMPMFISEMQSIVNEVQPEKTYFGFCDARVYEPVAEFERGAPITVDVRGGGGTDFRPVFEWIEQQGITPACLIYFTDMLGTFPPAPPDYPVLWITPTRRTAPFGETVEVQL